MASEKFRVEGSNTDTRQRSSENATEVCLSFDIAAVRGVVCQDVRKFILEIVMCV